jgi:predicted nucleotidyltransferase
MDDLSRTGLNKSVIKSIQDVLAGFPRVEKAVLYGSRAKGTARKYSDIVLTLAGNGLSYEDLVRLENKLDDLLLPYNIDLSLLSRIESEDLREHIERVGVVLFEAGS